MPAPPSLYHSNLNPIELVWAEVKRLVALENKTFKIKDIKQHTMTALSKIDKQYWNKCEDHVNKFETEYWQREGLQFMQPAIVVDLMCSSSDSD